MNLKSTFFNESRDVVLMDDRYWNLPVFRFFKMKILRTTITCDLTFLFTYLDYEQSN